MPKQKRSFLSRFGQYNEKRKKRMYTAKGNEVDEQHNDETIGITTRSGINTAGFYTRILVEWIGCDCCGTVNKKSLFHDNARQNHFNLPETAKLCPASTKFNPSSKEPFCRHNSELNQLTTG